MSYRVAVVYLLAPLMAVAQQPEEQDPERLFLQSQQWFLDGEYGPALHGFATAWKEFARTRGEADPLTIDARIFHGQLLTMSGHPNDAMTVLGPISQGSSRQAMIARGSFAMALRQAGQLDRATKILKGLIRTFPPGGQGNPVHLGRMHSELAVCLAYTGHLREAETNAREALRLLDQADHPHVSYRVSVNTILGQIYLLGNRNADAHRALVKAKAEAQSYWNPRHPELAILEGALGVAAFRAGRHEEAERRTRTALTATEKLLGPGHPEVGAIAQHLALVLKKQKRNDESREWAARARSILERSRVEPKVSAWSWREVK